MKKNVIVVLVVDDSADQRELIRAIFETSADYQILEAEDGVEALDVLNKNKVNCIISDWNMPNMDGLDFLKKIKADLRYKNTPFMMLTGEEMSRGSVLEAMTSGVDDFLIKPFSTTDLCKKTEKLLSKGKAPA